MDAQDGLMFNRAPTSRRPLLGITVLVVEDSRFASEAVRLLCLRSGARIRRAYSLETARRHLGIYRPTVLLVDIGLPDGSGIELIEGVADAHPRVDVILGMSGEHDHEAATLAAGADGFLAKPVNSVAAFQNMILPHLPKDRQPPGPWMVHDEKVVPDSIAYQDDLTHVAQILRDRPDAASLSYATQFLSGVADSAQDHDLGAAVNRLAQMRAAGRDYDQGLSQISQMLDDRIATGVTV